MKILAFAASNNRHSINRILVNHAAQLIKDTVVETLDIHNYEMPIFSDDRETELGQPNQAQSFYQKISDADAIIISFAEHNGGFTAAYKNLIDWTSRISTKVFQQKPTVFLSTSPGAGGGAKVLAIAVESAIYFGADLKASFAVPRFHESFDSENSRFRNADFEESFKNTVLSLIQPGTLAA